MRKNLFFIVLVLLAFTNLSGCISEDSDTTTMELMVNYEQTNGTIIESYEDGELTSKDTITLDFDFSNTKSPNKIITYGIDINSASEPVTVDASSKSTISIEFLEHGLYHLDAYAVDGNGIIENTSIIVRIDLRIEWAEYNTNDPKILPIDPTPNNNATRPYMMELSSVVENPSIIDAFGGGGQSVEFSWQMYDESDDACLSKNGKVDDGETDEWYVIHFNTYELHELRIVYEDGQDYINIEHLLSLTYHEDESEPNI